jgi:hypothetical protein
VKLEFNRDGVMLILIVSRRQCREKCERRELKLSQDAYFGSARGLSRSVRDPFHMLTSGSARGNIIVGLWCDGGACKLVHEMSAVDIKMAT